MAVPKADIDRDRGGKSGRPERESNRRDEQGLSRGS